MDKRRYPTVLQVDISLVAMQRLQPRPPQYGLDVALVGIAQGAGEVVGVVGHDFLQKRQVAGGERIFERSENCARAQSVAGGSAVEDDLHPVVVDHDPFDQISQVQPPV